MTRADFQLYYGVLPEPMLLASPNGVICAANQSAAALLNRSVSELAGLSLSDLASGPQEALAQLLSRFSRSGQFVPGALKLKVSSGELVCRVEGARLRGGQALLLRLQVHHEAVGRFRSLNERIANLNRAIFDRTQAARSSALLSAIVDSSEDAIISKNLEGVILTWNHGAERLFGYTASEAVGKSIALIIPPDRLDEEPRILERLRRGEQVEHYETIRVRKDGTRLNISLTISPIRDIDGRICGASKIARDVTARVRQEKALFEAHEALKRANSDLQQFAYSASHDLQEPLRTVATYSELFKKRYGGRLDEDADEYIRFMVEGAARMENLLRNLRIYTHVSTAEHAPLADIDANEILGKTLDGLDLTIRESAAVVTSDALPHVPMHEFQMEQLFQNLITNAIRYRNSQPPRIHVAAEGGSEEWLFSVRDNGIGIEPKFREQIFRIFQRLHTNSKYPGTGMGLAICQRIIERAGGRIWVESEPGCGSTFYFTVPVPLCRRISSSIIPAGLLP